MTSRPSAIGGYGRGKPVNLTAQQQQVPGANQNRAISSNRGQNFGGSDFGQSGFGSGGGDNSGFRSNNSLPSAGNECYNCSAVDHLARDCREDRRNRYSSNLGSGSFGASNFQSNANNSAENRFGGDQQVGNHRLGRGRGCFSCGQFGHMSKDCPNPSPKDNSSGVDKCFRCNEFGHFSRDCIKGRGDFAGGAQESATAKKPLSTYVPEEASIDDLWRQHIPAGINFDRFYHIDVEVSGSDNNLEKILSFNEAGLPRQLLDNVQKAGFNTPTPIQQNAIPYILAGRDMMACAQTGSGKTAAFLLPILTSMMRSEASMITTPGQRQEPIVLVVAPTRELAIQIKDEARKFAAGTKAMVLPVYGGTAVMHQANKLRQGCNILVATPGRLLDFINRGRIGLNKCKYLVLDEADRMLDMGFEADMRRLVHQTDMPPKIERQTLMFSATFPREVQQLATEFLNEHIFITVGKVGSANMDIVQEILLVMDLAEKKDLAIEFIKATMDASKDEDGKFHKKTLVFVKLKKAADNLCSFLCQSDVPTTSFHGDRKQEERELVFCQFKSGQFPVMIATDVASRGLDIEDVDHVINYDMPKDITDYVHRIGRTARVGNVGRATTFFDPNEDTAIAKDLLKVLRDAQQKVPDWLESLVQNGYYRNDLQNSEASFNDAAGDPW